MCGVRVRVRGVVCGVCVKVVYLVRGVEGDTLFHHLL